MIRFYAIPLGPKILEPEDYAVGWLEDCLQRCKSSFCVTDYDLTIEVCDGCRRAVFICKCS